MAESRQLFGQLVARLDPRTGHGHKVTIVDSTDNGVELEYCLLLLPMFVGRMHSSECIDLLSPDPMSLVYGL